MPIDNNNFSNILDCIKNNVPDLTVLEIDITQTDKNWIPKLIDALLGKDSGKRNIQITSIIFVRPIINPRLPHEQGTPQEINIHDRFLVNIKAGHLEESSDLCNGIGPLIDILSKTEIREFKLTCYGNFTHGDNISIRLARALADPNSKISSIYFEGAFSGFTLNTFATLAQEYPKLNTFVLKNRRYAEFKDYVNFAKILPKTSITQLQVNDIRYPFDCNMAWRISHGIGLTSDFGEMKIQVQKKIDEALKGNARKLVTQAFNDNKKSPSEPLSTSYICQKLTGSASQDIGTSVSIAEQKSNSALLNETKEVATALKALGITSNNLQNLGCLQTNDLKILKQWIDQFQTNMSLVENRMISYSHLFPMVDATKVQQAQIDQDPNLQRYQLCLQAELIRFMIAYWLLPTGLFKLEENAKATMLNAMKDIPTIGFLLKILFSGVKSAYHSYLFKQINNLAQLFTGVSQIEEVCEIVARQMTHDRLEDIQTQNFQGIESGERGILAKTAKFYHSVKTIIADELKDCKTTSHKQGVKLEPVELMAVSHGSLLLDRILQDVETIKRHLNTHQLAGALLKLIEITYSGPIISTQTKLESIPQTMIHSHNTSVSNNLEKNVDDLKADIQSLKQATIKISDIETKVGKLDNNVESITRAIGLGNGGIKLLQNKPGIGQGTFDEVEHELHDLANRTAFLGNQIQQAHESHQNDKDSIHALIERMKVRDEEIRQLKEKSNQQDQKIAHQRAYILSQKKGCVIL